MGSFSNSGVVQSRLGCLARVLAAGDDARCCDLSRVCSVVESVVFIAASILELSVTGNGLL